MTLRLAHRGDWRHGRENSLAAFGAAMVIAACDGVEFDVRLSRDGVPVLLHDATLDRVQGRQGRVDELDADELGAAGVPTLAQVLELLPAEAFLDVELKGAHGAETARVLRAGRGDTPPAAVITSFEPDTLAAMAGHLPGWRRWLNDEPLGPATVSLARDLGCSAVSVRWEAVTPAAMRMAHAAGIDVAAWTVRRRATFDRMARLGVVACCVEGAALDG